MIVRELFTTWDFNVDFTKLDKMDKKIGRLIDSTDRVGKNFRRMSQGVRDTGLRMTAFLTAPIALFGFTTLKAAGQFEKGMNNVRALTQATGDEFTKLENLAKNLGETTQFTATEAADAMGFLAQAGLTTNEVFGALPSTLLLAGAADIEFAETADIVTNVMTGMGIEAQDLDQVVDVLTKTFVSSNTNLQQLGQAMKFAGSIAKGFNVSLNDTVAILGSMGNAGIQAEMAGTALRGALQRLANPTKEAEGILKSLGVQTLDNNGQFRQLLDILGDLEKANISTAQTFELFGARAGTGINTLLQRGIKTVRDFSTELESAEGIAAQINKQKLEGFFGSLKKLTSAFESLQLAIAGSGLLEFVTKVTKNITKFIRRLSSTSDSALRMFTVFALVVALFPPLLLGLGLTGLALGGIATGFGIAKIAILAFRAASIKTLLVWAAIPILITGAVVLVIAILEDLFAFFIGGQSVIGEFFKFFGASQADLQAFGVFTSALFSTLFSWIVTIGEVLGSVLVVGFLLLLESVKDFFKFLNGEESTIGTFLKQFGVLGKLITAVFQEPLKQVKSLFAFLNKIGKLAGGALFDIFGDALLDKPDEKSLGARIFESGKAGIGAIFGAPSLAKPAGSTSTTANSNNSNVVVNVALNGDTSPEKLAEVGDVMRDAVTDGMERANRKAINELAAN